MHKKYNKFLIISFTLVFILGVYSYFYNGFIEQVSSADSSLTSSLGTSDVAITSDISTKAAEDTAFLMKLASLTSITIDTSLFSDQSFKLLVDNNIKLEPTSYGRINPFSPTDKVAQVDNKSNFTLTTNPASAITTKSAVLNGTLEGEISNNVYFEYGTTPTLGKVTPKVKTSLVGNFASVISGLTPKTSYFYRADANVNGTLVFGEIIPFNTN